MMSSLWDYDTENMISVALFVIPKNLLVFDIEQLKFEKLLLPQ